MESSEVNPFQEFGPEISDAVDGLIYLGALTKEVEFCGHTFGLKTLTVAEEIAASSIIQSVRNTLSEPNAWAAAQVGLALTHVDAEEHFCPSIGPGIEVKAKARYNFIANNWYWPIIQFLYNEYLTLIGKQNEAIRAVQSLSNRGLPTSTPDADSLIEPGILLDAENPGNLPLLS